MHTLQTFGTKMNTDGTVFLKDVVFHGFCRLRTNVLQVASYHCLINPTSSIGFLTHFTISFLKFILLVVPPGG